jgi:hypothetical protein
MLSFSAFSLQDLSGYDLLFYIETCNLIEIHKMCWAWLKASGEYQVCRVRLALPARVVCASKTTGPPFSNEHGCFPKHQDVFLILKCVWSEEAEITTLWRSADHVGW